MNPFITDDVRITDIRPLISPAILMQDFPASHEASKVVFDAREEFRRILKKEDDRLAVMVGPCSIHDTVAAIDYAGRLAEAFVFPAGRAGMLILKLLSREDMYGYQMIESLAALSDDTFSLKAGTLYPLLHNMEENGLVTCYEAQAGQARIRKYYSITKEGRKALEAKENEWQSFTQAVEKVLKGGVSYAY